MPSYRGSPADTISGSLIQQLQIGDERAWARLLELYAPLVFYWCRVSGLQSEDAADVVQEVFRSIHRGIGSFRRDRSGDTFRGWLRTITQNKIRDFLRSCAKHPVAVGGTDAQLEILEQAAEESEGSAGFGPFTALVHRALRLIQTEFESRTWQAFWRSLVHQGTAAEVAAELGMTPGAVRQAKYKVLRRLRQELGDAD